MTDAARSGNAPHMAAVNPLVETPNAIPTNVQREKF
jgi:hypothetical protein